MKLFDLLRKKHAYLPKEDTDSSTQKSIITGTGRDYNSLDTYDIALKFWLPEVMETALNELCEYTQTTRSDIVRQILFSYLYGRYDLVKSIEKSELEFSLNDTPLFSRSTSLENRTPELGKNIEDVKVMIAHQMKEDIEQLANKANLSLSHFIREIMISNLFGHSYLPEREGAESFNLTVEMKKECN